MASACDVADNLEAFDDTELQQGEAAAAQEEIAATAEYDKLVAAMELASSKLKSVRGVRMKYAAALQHRHMGHWSIILQCSLPFLSWTDSVKMSLVCRAFLGESKDKEGKWRIASPPSLKHLYKCSLGAVTKFTITPRCQYTSSIWDAVNLLDRIPHLNEISIAVILHGEAFATMMNKLPHTLNKVGVHRLQPGDVKMLTANLPRWSALTCLDVEAQSGVDTDIAVAQMIAQLPVSLQTLHIALGSHCSKSFAALRQSVHRMSNLSTLSLHCPDMSYVNALKAVWGRCHQAGKPSVDSIVVGACAKLFHCTVVGPHNGISYEKMWPGVH